MIDRRVLFYVPSNMRKRPARLRAGCWVSSRPVNLVADVHAMRGMGHDGLLPDLRRTREHTNVRLCKTSWRVKVHLGN